MEIRTLRSFVEVVRQGGFSKAAKVVFATQSTVSKAVKQLEDELGMPLLDRLAQGSRLTAAGEIVYRRALRLLAERDDLLAELEALRGLRRGVLHLGLPPVGSSTLFAPLFARYRQKYPEVELRLIEHGSARLEQHLLAGEIELAAALLPLSDELDWQEVRREPLVVMLPPGHPLAGRAKLTMGELRASPFLLFEQGFALNRIVLAACRRHGFEPTVSARSAQLDFLVELVAAGVGVAFLPRMLAQSYTQRSVTLRPVRIDEPDTDWHLVMAWRKGAYLSHAGRAWLELVRETYGRRAAARRRATTRAP